MSQQAEKAKGVAWTPLLQLWKAGVSAWQDSSHLVGREDTGGGGGKGTASAKEESLVGVAVQTGLYVPLRPSAQIPRGPTSSSLDI